MDKRTYMYAGCLSSILYINRRVCICTVCFHPPTLTLTPTIVNPKCSSPSATPSIASTSCAVCPKGRYTHQLGMENCLFCDKV